MSGRRIIITDNNFRQPPWSLDAQLEGFCSENEDTDGCISRWPVCSLYFVNYMQIGFLCDDLAELRHEKFTG